MHMRTVVVGNSGSGKTWLARRLAEKVGSSVVHLDEIFWLPSGFNEKRDPSDVSRLIDVRRAEEQWIVEGVYGNLAKQFLPSALTLVWLDLPWSVCKQRLELRGSESKAHMEREQSVQGLQELIHWAEDYWSRHGASSQAAHLALFETFQGQRFRLGSETQVREYLSVA
jgi:adenylate kinase family enzyme